MTVGEMVTGYLCGLTAAWHRMCGSWGQISRVEDNKKMAKDKNERYDNRIGGGRVVDKEKGTVYSPKQIDKMERKSDEKRDK